MLGLLAIVAWFSVAPAFDVRGESPPDPPNETPTPVAEPAPAADPPDEAAVPAEPDPAIDAMRVRAARLRALIDGTLDLEVDPRSLLVLDLANAPVVGVDGNDFIDLLQSVQPTAEPGDGEPAATASGTDETDEARAAEAVVDPLAAAAEDLRAALRAWLAEPADRRAALLAAHASRQQAAEAAALADETARARTEALTRIADDLQSFLDETLDPYADPRPLLALDLGDASELSAAAGRRARFLAVARPDANPTEAAGDGAVPDAPAAAPAETPPASTMDPEVAAALDAAEDRLDALRLSYLRRTPTERVALLRSHEQRRAEQEALRAEEAAAAAAAEAATAEEIEAEQQISQAEREAEEAALEREQALEAARLARTQTKRILEEERARLLGVKQSLASFEAELTRRKAERVANHDKTLHWTARVGELLDSSIAAGDRAGQADAMYEPLRADLAVLRSRLREELSRARGVEDEVPRVGEGSTASLPADVDRGDVATLRREVDQRREELVALAGDVAWELAEGLRDDVVLLNRTRLTLLEVASSGLRDDVTGFGPAGIDQVRRELDQISVELSFHALQLPRRGRALLSHATRAPVPTLLVALQLALALVAFFWWRGRADGALAAIHQRLVDRRPPTRITRASVTVVWYVERIRRPLELLLLLWAAMAIVGSTDVVRGVELLWAVLSWVLLGLAAILFVDAIAAREQSFSDTRTDASSLRIHSLRVVGINIIAVGLTLSLTDAMVGEGAIYRWVLSTCWALSIPVAIYLVQRWKPIVFERFEHAADRGAIRRFVLARRRGLASFAAATIGGVALLGRGLVQWGMRQISALETTRRVLAYLFRREVARQAAAAAADATLRRVGDDVYAAFGPDLPPSTILSRPAEQELQRVLSHVRTPEATLTAVIGERGAGKSTFVRRVAEALPDTDIRVLTCPEAGFEALIAMVAELTADPQARGEALAVALRDAGPLVIVVDDAHRLIIPAVRGLRGLDRFTALARTVAGRISWLLTFDVASWQYIQRARGDRVFFEQVVLLPRWTEDQLGELFEARAAAAGVQPSYDGLIVPRAADGTPGAGDRTRQGYHRLLWDHADGNPAVALQAFRESLFVTEDDRMVVRMFGEPHAQEIERLSLPLLFVLRAVVQLELAREHEIIAATQLPAADVADAVRFCVSRKYVEPIEDGVRLTWPWFRTITRVLHRQHLLSKS